MTVTDQVFYDNLDDILDSLEKELTEEIAKRNKKEPYAHCCLSLEHGLIAINGKAGILCKNRPLEWCIHVPEATSIDVKKEEIQNILDLVIKNHVDFYDKAKKYFKENPDEEKVILNWTPTHISHYWRHEFE